MCNEVNYMGTKQAEIDYPDKLDVAEQKWLYTKPFGNYNREESSRTFQDFSTILFLINKYVKTANSILDLGCGPGWLSIFLAQMGFKVAGYDISPAMISVAKERAKSLKLDVSYGAADIESTLIKSEINRHDLVIIYDALHHCQSDEAVISKIYSYLKPGGIMILAEPNKAHGTDKGAHAAVERFGVTERGLDIKKLRNICRQVGFVQSWRYHASGQSYIPRNETFLESIKMLRSPFLARFYFGKTQTRIWLVAKKAAK